MLGARSACSPILSSLAVVVLATLGLLTQAQAACLKDHREVKLDKGSAKVRSYLCDAGDGTSSAPLKVEFYRLSEASAGSLLMETRYDDLERVIGKPRVIKNAVFETGAGLFKEFGTKSTAMSCYRFTVDVPKGGKAYDSSEGELADAACGQKTFWYLSNPDQAGMTWFEMPLPKDAEHIKQKNTWPPGYSFFYSDCEAEFEVDCTLLWRYLTLGDVRAYEENKKAYEAYLKAGEPAAEADLDDKAEAAVEDTDAADGDPITDDGTKYRALTEWLARPGLPKDFFVVIGSASETCAGFDFFWHTRQLIMDVVTVENASDQTLTVEGLLGAYDKVESLRPLAKNPGYPASTVAFPDGNLSLKPGEKVMIPLRLTFAQQDGLRELFSKPDIAKRRFAAIQAKAPGSMLQSSEADDGGRIMKTRESFGSPQIPRMENYVYGPDISPRGLALAGQQVLFDETSNNYLEITVGEGYGSCPYLYAFDGAQKTWVHYGKIIHEANGKRKEMTAEIKLASYATKFRIAEEELELSHIDRANLKLELADGTFVVLKPDVAALADPDEVRVRVAADQRVAFSFTTPPWLDPDMVKHTTLIVTGYYERYSTLLMTGR